MTKTKTAQADIDFEKELWDAANELRGAVSENNYKNYILPLIFLKHLSERFEIGKDELSFCKSATLKEVQKQDYKLTPGIYVGTEAEEDDGIPFEQKMEALKTTLEMQFKKGEELKQQILENFNRF